MPVPASTGELNRAVLGAETFLASSAFFFAAAAFWTSSAFLAAAAFLASSAFFASAAFLASAAFFASAALAAAFSAACLPVGSGPVRSLALGAGRSLGGVAAPGFTWRRWPGTIRSGSVPTRSRLAW